MKQAIILAEGGGSRLIAEDHCQKCSTILYYGEWDVCDDCRDRLDDFGEQPGT